MPERFTLKNLLIGDKLVITGMTGYDPEYYPNSPDFPHIPNASDIYVYTNIESSDTTFITEEPEPIQPGDIYYYSNPNHQ